MAFAKTLQELRRSAAALRADASHALIDSMLRRLPLTPARAAYLAMVPEVRVVAAYRFYSALHRAGHVRLAQLAYLRAKRRYGCDLHPAAEIGPGLRIAHAQDIVVGPEVRVGSEVMIFNGVTLGNKLGRTAWLGMPRVGDAAVLGTGAKILGAVEVGARSRVGANAVVLTDVPPDATAVGAPARVVPAPGAPVASRSKS